MTMDDWTNEGALTTTTPAVLEVIRRAIETESPVVVEHRFYRGGRAPHRFVCDDYAELEDYFRTQAQPGDAFLFWNFEQCCTDGNALTRAKTPDSSGRVPVGGAY